MNVLIKSNTYDHFWWGRKTGRKKLANTSIERFLEKNHIHSHVEVEILIVFLPFYQS